VRIISSARLIPSAEAIGSFRHRLAGRRSAGRTQEDRIARSDAQVAPKGKLKPARNGVTLDRGDDRLAQQHASASQRPVAIENDAVPAPFRYGFQIGTGAVISMTAGQHGNF
jgi:hypothetical protein